MSIFQKIDDLMHGYNGKKYYTVKLRRHRNKNKFGFIINNWGLFKRKFAAILKDYGWGVVHCTYVPHP